MVSREQIETPIMTLAKDRMIGNGLSEGGMATTPLTGEYLNYQLASSGEILANLLCGKLDIVLGLYSQVVFFRKFYSYFSFDAREKHFKSFLIAN